MDNSYTAFLNDTLSTISSGYLLCDATGVCIMPADQAGKHVFSVNDISASEEYTKIGDMTVFKVDVAPRLYLALYSKDDSGVDVGKMACAYIKAALNVQNKEMSKERFYAMTVMQKLSIADTPSLCARRFIGSTAPQCFLLSTRATISNPQTIWSLRRR